MSRQRLDNWHTVSLSVNVFRLSLLFGQPEDYCDQPFSGILTTDVENGGTQQGQENFFQRVMRMTSCRCGSASRVKLSLVANIKKPSSCTASTSSAQEQPISLGLPNLLEVSAFMRLFAPLRTFLVFLMFYKIVDQAKFYNFSEHSEIGK